MSSVDIGNPIYDKHANDVSIIKDVCKADVYLEDESVTPVEVEFCYVIMNDGFVNVTVNKINKEFFGVPSDLKYDITVAIGMHIDRKINEISWT